MKRSACTMKEVFSRGLACLLAAVMLLSASGVPGALAESEGLLPESETPVVSEVTESSTDSLQTATRQNNLAIWVERVRGCRSIILLTEVFTLYAYEVQIFVSTFILTALVPSPAFQHPLFEKVTKERHKTHAISMSQERG